MCARAWDVLLNEGQVVWRRERDRTIGSALSNATFSKPGSPCQLVTGALAIYRAKYFDEPERSGRGDHESYPGYEESRRADFASQNYRLGNKHQRSWPTLLLCRRGAKPCHRTLFGGYLLVRL